MKNLREALFSRKNLSKNNTIVKIENLEVEFIKNEDIFKFSIYNKGNRNDSVSCCIALYKIKYIIDKIKNNKPEYPVLIWGSRDKRAYLEISTLDNDETFLNVSDCKHTNRILIHSKDDKEYLINFLEKYNI